MLPDQYKSCSRSLRHPTCSRWFLHLVGRDSRVRDFTETLSLFTGTLKESSVQTAEQMSDPPAKKTRGIGLRLGAFLHDTGSKKIAAPKASPEPPNVKHAAKDGRASQFPFIFIPLFCRTLISTRRFWARPAAVLLLATGLFSPYPNGCTSRRRSKPCFSTIY